MIEIENVEVVGFGPAIRGMRNPKNSWDRSDSDVCIHYECENNYCCECTYRKECNAEPEDIYTHYIIGPNDLKLCNQLSAGGAVHAKYRRYIDVYVDVTAPLYWWKEFETYRNVVADNPFDIESNSCSTMHKLDSRDIVKADFSCEKLEDEWSYLLDLIIAELNVARTKFKDTNDKKYWYQMIQLLPNSYNQTRTLKLNYEVLSAMYEQRRYHKLDEWQDFCDWIEELPYSEIITGK